MCGMPELYQAHIFDFNIRDLYLKQINKKTYLEYLIILSNE